jgi:phosphatidylethanolamine/phosphatidyl-N-methylethanolamine N-methyltransferase
MSLAPIRDQRPPTRRARGPDTELMRNVYARWAPVYDLTYRHITAPGRREAVKAASRCGDDILEVGVGTGMALEEYRSGKCVVGTDLSAEMLRRAAGKVRERRMTHVKGLAVMDACRLGFPDARFDAVAAQMVITLVPEPERALDEFARVLKPGGEIVLVNHFGADGGPRASVEEFFAPIVSKVGWSSDFKVKRLDDWARARGGMRVVSVKPMPPVGFFTVVRIEKER